MFITNTLVYVAEEVIFAFIGILFFTCITFIFIIGLGVVYTRGFLCGLAALLCWIVGLVFVCYRDVINKYLIWPRPLKNWFHVYLAQPPINFLRIVRKRLWDVAFCK